MSTTREGGTARPQSRPDGGFGWHRDWSTTDGHRRARLLYAIARIMQKNARLFAVLESLDNGKPIRESRDIDVPLAIRHFYYHAGLAQLVATEMPAHGRWASAGR